ncbi:HD-GYP domain-containing protein [Niveibacterium sp. SC-1]|uniref:HD-GYP domain-containing protein n=1 Tax=Niveibacterium sp. SC-1 TaxID=3135646 RepID=UPI00311F5D11
MTQRSRTAMPDGQEAHYIRLDQLCVGIYVHLDLSWMDHPFTFSSFLIKSEEQIAKICALGLARVRYEPGRSLSAPLSVETAPEAGDVQAVPVAGNATPDARIQEKREQVRRHREQARVIGETEHAFVQSTKTFKAIHRNLLSRPEETLTGTHTLVSGMVDSLLTDKDVTVHLMPERIAGEEMYLHAMNTTVLSLMLARELNTPRGSCIELGVGALLHDIGKADVPDRVRLKQEALTRVELELLHEHVGFGVAMGRRLGLSAEALSVIAQHHEAVDGSGYPHGLRGEQISLLAKVVAIANNFDNLCNPANPARVMTPHEALSMMYSQQRARFEPGALSVFIRCLGVYPPGTIVVLANERYGIVTAVNSSRPLRPVVQVCDARRPDDLVLVHLEDEPDLAITRTIRPAQLPKAVFESLAPRHKLSYYFDAHGGYGKPAGTRAQGTPAEAPAEQGQLT